MSTDGTSPAAGFAFVVAVTTAAAAPAPPNPAAIDHPRVRIRADLAGLGLAPRDASTEPEDHFAGLFDAMRVLVAGGAGRGPATLEEQRRFFQSHLAPAFDGFLKATARAPQANYYRRVAALAAAFLAIESESFELD